MAHTLEYKGYTVTCENGNYRIAGQGKKVYASFQAVKEAIDKIEEPENYINLGRNKRKS